MIKLRTSALTWPESYTTNLLNSSKLKVVKLCSASTLLKMPIKVSLWTFYILIALLISLVKSDVI